MVRPIREVWSRNYMEELALLEQNLRHHRVLVIDSEFPGYLIDSDQKDSTFTRYSKLKKNVDATNMIQLGVSVVSDLGVVVGSWEFNFEFNLAKELHNVESVEFLKSHGMIFPMLAEFGIKVSEFSRVFGGIVATRADLLWVTFHGLYDLGYLLKILTGQPLPDSELDFAQRAGRVFGSVLDLKFVATYFDSLYNGKLGLERLANIFGVKRIGEAHQAGSDSMLTALVYAKMESTLGIHEDAFGGFLFGVDERIICLKSINNPLFAPCYDMMHRFDRPFRPIQAAQYCYVGPEYHLAAYV